MYIIAFLCIFFFVCVFYIARNLRFFNTMLIHVYVIVEGRGVGIESQLKDISIRLYSKELGVGVVNWLIG
jgi:hypothetical protein